MKRRGLSISQVSRSERASFELTAAYPGAETRGPFQPRCHQEVIGMINVQDLRFSSDIKVSGDIPKSTTGLLRE